MFPPQALNIREFAGLEKVSSDPENRAAVFRLHKQSGTTYDFDVSFSTEQLIKATEAKIVKAHKRFLKDSTDRDRATRIVQHINHPDWQLNPYTTCIVDTSVSYKGEEPKTISDWIIRANEDVSIDNPPLTLILDLDDTVLSKNKSCSFDTLDSLHGGTYFNLTAMKQISAFQKRGHKIKVLTNSQYLFRRIESAFSRYGVTLEKKNYFNVESKARNGLSKGDFLDKYSFNKSCLHVDDLTSNESRKTHFYHVTGASPFPELIKDS
ncbi:hypothetical protein SOPP22_10760 [Shewanella sp. OPT22]|nr:hypothetical protein SOPP22_10760 [Shewanella sp. OPT22]